MDLSNYMINKDDILQPKNSGKCSLKYIKCHYPNDYESIIKLEGSTFSEKLYRYLFPEVHNTCLVCGSPTRFLSISEGFRKYCSAKCSYNDRSRIDHMKETNLIRYGVEWSSQTDNCKQKVKETKRDRYGDENYSNQEQAKQTSLERYGVEHYSKTNSFKESIKRTSLNKYGCENYTQSKEYKDRVRNEYIESHDHVIGIYDNYDNPYGALFMCKCPHPDCNKCQEKTFEIYSTYYFNRINNGIEICTKLLPITKGHQSGTTIELFVRSILDKYNIEYETNNRTILNGKEVDVYIPSKKLAIECNGVYWHSKVDNKYHYNKWLECSRKGIQLLTVWEDQIVHKPEIIESIILSKLGIYNERIGARKCEIREVSSRESTIFLNENHLQGSVNSRVRLGLYYNNELVSLMTFGSKRKCMNGRNDQWELHRYGNKKGVQVVGGASKLFKYFIDTYKPTSIESFSSNDISNGELYKQLGFNDNGSQYGSYWYIEPSTMMRYHRYNFRKNVLVAEGYDASKSETQIMSERRYFKIYDSGQLKWTINIL